MDKVIITGQSLTLDEVIAVSRNHAFIELDKDAKKNVQESRKIVEQLVQEGKVVYGVTTGFGKFCDEVITIQQQPLYQRIRY